MEQSKPVDLSKKVKQFKPHQVVHAGKTFVFIDGEDDVIMLTNTVNRVSKYVEVGGQPVLNKKNNRQMYDIEAGVAITIITMDEYDAIKKSGLVEK